MYKVAQTARKRAIASSVESQPKRRRIEINRIPIEPTPIQYTSIHKRYFFHTLSNRPFLIRDRGESDDSSDEMDYVRLHQKIHASEINDIVDLNEGEKEMMNLWNTFLDGYKSFGIKHLTLICREFIDVHVAVILQSKLYRNFVLHLCTMYDNDIIGASDFLVLVQHLQRHVGITRLADPLTHETRGRGRGRKKKSADLELPTQNQWIFRPTNSTPLG